MTDRAVYKYIMHDAGGYKGAESMMRVLLPSSALIRNIDIQEGLVAVWAEVDMDDKDMVEHLFMVYPTGLPINKRYNGKFIKTVGTAGNEYVFHIYEADTLETKPRYQMGL